MAVIQISFSLYYAGEIVKQNQLLNSQQSLMESLRDKNLILQKEFYQLASLDKLIQFQNLHLPFPIKQTINPNENHSP